MPYDDLFTFFTWFLSWVATIYATVITMQSLWGWLVWLGGNEKYMTMLRRYLIVHGLRLRFSAFWGDVIVCILLCAVFLMMWHAHHIVHGTNQVVNGIRHAR